MGIIFNGFKTKVRKKSPTLVIDNVRNSENLIYNGDVHIKGNIGKNANITIEDGSLSVDGNIGDHSKINLKGKFTTVACCGFFCTAEIAVNDYDPLKIGGDVGCNVNIHTNSIDINVNGSIGHNCVLKTYSGNVNLEDVIHKAKISTVTGNIEAKNIGCNSLLKSKSGNISVVSVERNSSLKTISGNIKALLINHCVNVKTKSGNVYINNKRSMLKRALGKRRKYLGNELVI